MYCINLHGEDRIEEDLKSWFEFGERMGVIIFSSEEEEGKE